MIRLRRGTVLTVRARRPGLTECTVDVEGAAALALSYDQLSGPVAVGDIVVLNTTAVALELGTGGAHFVVAVEGREAGEVGAGRAMKLRYTPLQTSVEVVEETHTAALDALDGLDGLPVVVAFLHSALAPAVIGARAVAPQARIAYVMTDAAALPLAYSDTVAALREQLVGTITAGQAFGGDHESVSIFGALAAGRAVLGADVVVVAMGPGNLGTGSRLGFASLEVASIIDAVAAMGGRAVVAPRMSFADPRERHHGISHHTRTALGLALAKAEIALPSLATDRDAIARGQLAGTHHDIVEVDLGAAEDALRHSGIPLRSMGRGFDEDPDYFRAAAAAGVLATKGLQR